MSGWGCPHEIKGHCQRVNHLPCNPGMKGCVLFGRFVWADDSKNRPAGGWGDKEPKLPEVELNRLRWRCRRGMLELDLVLERFLGENYTKLTARQQAEFDTLLDLPDQDLWTLIRGGGTDVPEIVQFLRACQG